MEYQQRTAISNVYFQYKLIGTVVWREWESPFKRTLDYSEYQLKTVDLHSVNRIQ